MSVAILVLLLLGFSLVVAVGLFTVLQNLANPRPTDEPRMHHGPMFHDHGFYDQGAGQRRR